MREKFWSSQKVYRRRDDSLWTGADIERAARGEVTLHYMSKLRNGYYKDASFGKIAATSRAIGIPLEA